MGLFKCDYLERLNRRSRFDAFTQLLGVNQPDWLIKEINLYKLKLLNEALIYIFIYLFPPLKCFL